MIYFTYIDKSGKTLFFDKEQKKRENFVGKFELSENESKYFRYNGNGVEKDNLLYEIFVRENLAEYKTMLKKIVIEKYDNSIARLKANYPVEEVTGWDVKSIQSKLWLSTDDKQSLIDSDSVLMLKNESDGTIEGITNLAQRVMNNSNLYQTIYGKNTRKYKELLATLNVISTIQELSELESEVTYD